MTSNNDDLFLYENIAKPISKLYHDQFRETLQRQNKSRLKKLGDMIKENLS